MPQVNLLVTSTQCFFSGPAFFPSFCFFEVNTSNVSVQFQTWPPFHINPKRQSWIKRSRFGRLSDAGIPSGPLTGSHPLGGTQRIGSPPTGRHIAGCFKALSTGNFWLTETWNFNQQRVMGSVRTYFWSSRTKNRLRKDGYQRTSSQSSAIVATERAQRDENYRKKWGLSTSISKQPLGRSKSHNQN